MPTVGIIGAGTMGAGIAQIAAASGWTVELLDVDDDVVRKALDVVRKRFERLLEKGRMTNEQRSAAAERLHAARRPGCFSDCSVIIEAVTENINVKAKALLDVKAACRPDAIFATNTSSLSVTRIAQGFSEPFRTAGMHFFNPVPLMPLVEIIRGEQTHPQVIETLTQIAREWGKTPVHASDTPGFIVNRVARGYYLEPLRMLSEGIAGIDEIDGILTRLGGFRMGPFELMDLVGIDVNYTVSCSVWEQLGRPARLTPHPMQKELYDAQHFGRKTKQGWYTYQPEHPYPATLVQRKSFETPEQTRQAVRLFCERATDEQGSITEQYVFARTLVAIINEAALALDDQVASADDINTAMKLGTNYPLGPLEWAEKIGPRTCRFLLDALNRQAEDQRFAAAAWLRR